MGSALGPAEEGGPPGHLISYPIYYLIVYPLECRQRPRELGTLAMKAKLSATVEQALLAYLDSLPGETRSEKLERVLSRYKELQDELDLREQLASYYEDEAERRDREAWELTVAESQWRE